MPGPAHRPEDPGGPVVALTVHADLLPLLPARARRAGRLLVRHEEHATAGHVVQAAGVPLTEVGALAVDGSPASPADRLPPGAELHAGVVARPQPVPAGGFLLDVHLGSLARRMRLLGLDAAWSAHADDPDLVVRAREQDRVLLTADRGLLLRRALPRGALVRGAGADAQLADVLDRFRPALAPLTRCTACGSPLRAVAKEEVAAELPAGTRRTYDEFSRCAACGRVY
ncbi:Mut7-C ubiquitin/RNAse domain-containing protein [Paenibacillus sp. TRM 82003]|uniref:Mut7-C ubiquitin/RNAse domain-containing protein n=1 Tax=Kineococcus sp. TRM81007 TaxID=2925831 RepID=UPI001F5AD31A|nr:Mut7-C ubiquitin/RNAse domain-containing protein [Kineococcus sp. TRM81007]MCI2237271.1 Mut7-C ubiquitin/RNAse domain-containing protein [Kineococcus sp. TRM81007]MCI3919330.1 Mut7-C ubiquitin/RNAse domain-containing protein [Paenibacillus sp. TRM 82003]